MWFQQKSGDLAADQVELPRRRKKQNELQWHRAELMMMYNDAARCSTDAND